VLAAMAGALGLGDIVGREGAAILALSPAALSLATNSSVAAYVTRETANTATLLRPCPATPVLWKHNGVTVLFRHTRHAGLLVWRRADQPWRRRL
jgi:hypothetical protein